MVVNGGPQDPPGAKLVVNEILVGLLTLVLTETPWTLGAHFNESPTLPELPAPPVPEKDIEIGFADQSALGAELEA